MQSTRLVSFNANGLNIEIKRKNIFRRLRDKKFDIILLQKTHSSPPLENIWTSQWGGGKPFGHMVKKIPRE